jgi:hypothetical protein
MEATRTKQPYPQTIAYQDWAGVIQMSTDVDQLVRVFRAYLLAWTPQQLNRLPHDLAAQALFSSEDIVSRSVTASRAELRFEGSREDHNLLREMTLTLAAAATRLRMLKAFGARL